MAYGHKMKTHSPSGHVGGGHEAKIHQKGMHHKAPHAVEPHPKGGSVNVEPRGSAHHVAHVSVPGPRSA